MNHEDSKSAKGGTKEGAILWRAGAFGYNRRQEVMGVDSCGRVERAQWSHDAMWAAATTALAWERKRALDA